MELLNIINKNVKPTVLTLQCVQHLLSLCDISSSTLDFDGVFEVQRHVDSFLKNLDFTTQYYRHPQDTYAPVLMGYYDVHSPITVTLVFHADTVLETQNQKIQFSEEKKKIFGPGVADDKGGITVALQGLLEFFKYGEPNFNIRVVSSSCEEVGSQGFLDLFESFGKSSDYVLGFEPSLANGSIINSRHGNRWYNVNIKGQEAHAGRCSGEEIDAAHEAALKIVKLKQMIRGISGAKLNVAGLGGGSDKYNIVCGHTCLKLDTRFETRQIRDDLHSQIVTILNESHLINNKNEKSQTQFHIVDDCPPLQKSFRSQRLENFILKEISRIEMKKTNAEHSGGASDVNHMCIEENICLDGLGPVGGELHTMNEYVVIESLKTRAQAIVNTFNYLREFRSV